MVLRDGGDDCDVHEALPVVWLGDDVEEAEAQLIEVSVWHEVTGDGEATVRYTRWCCSVVVLLTVVLVCLRFVEKGKGTEGKGGWRGR